MKTTRRRLLSLIGLGAAAAALAPAQSVGAAECHQCLPDSQFPHVYGHPEAVPVMPTLTDGQVWVLSSEVTQARADRIFLLGDDGDHVTVGEWDRLRAAVEQALADGYNSGYTQATLRAESRQDGFRFLRQGERHS